MFFQGKHPGLEPPKHLGTVIQTKKVFPYQTVFPGDKGVRWAGRDTKLDVSTPENIASLIGCTQEYPAKCQVYLACTFASNTTLYVKGYPSAF